VKEKVDKSCGGIFGVYNRERGWHTAKRNVSIWLGDWVRKKGKKFLSMNFTAFLPRINLKENWKVDKLSHIFSFYYWHKFSFKFKKVEVEDGRKRYSTMIVVMSFERAFCHEISKLMWTSWKKRRRINKFNKEPSWLSCLINNNKKYRLARWKLLH
jgi:hypothetical protein